MAVNTIIKIVIIFLLTTILIMLLVLSIKVLKDHKSSFKFYKSIIEEKDKKLPNKSKKKGK